MNIMKMKNRDEAKYKNILQYSIKNKDIFFIIFLSFLFLIFQFTAGKIEDFEQRVFTIEVIKMPFLFLLPFFIMWREKKVKWNMLFCIFSSLILISIAVLNKLGLSGVYFGHNVTIFETVGIESIAAVILYMYPIYYMVKIYFYKNLVSNMAKGVFIGVLLVFNYLSFKEVLEFNIYGGNNIYVYILIGMMALYYGILEEFYYRVAIMDTFLKNGMKPILAFVIVALLQTVGVIFADPVLRLNYFRLIASFSFLFGSAMFFSYLYMKTGKNIIAASVAKAFLIAVFYLSYKGVWI